MTWKRKLLLGICLIALFLCGCENGDAEPETVAILKTVNPESNPAETSMEEIGESEMKLWINDSLVPVSWDENATVRELDAETSRADIVVDMSMYGGNEQVGPLGRDYTRKDVQMRTVNGDIVLYSGDQIVVFYGSNSWSYTHLGKIMLDASEITELLANGDVTLRLTK